MHLGERVLAVVHLGERALLVVHLEERHLLLSISVEVISHC